MRARDEEEPDEPDEPDDPDETPAVGSQLVPTVSPAGREMEFRTEVVSVAQVTDGKTLPALLTKASADGWDLHEVIDVGDRKALLLRRPKRNEREERRVGFAPPGAS